MAKKKAANKSIFDNFGIAKARHVKKMQEHAKKIHGHAKKISQIKPAKLGHPSKPWSNANFMLGAVLVLMILVLLLVAITPLA